MACLTLFNTPIVERYDYAVTYKSARICSSMTSILINQKNNTSHYFKVILENKKWSSILFSSYDCNGYFCENLGTA